MTKFMGHDDRHQDGADGIDVMLRRQGQASLQARRRVAQPIRHPGMAEFMDSDAHDKRDQIEDRSL